MKTSEKKLQTAKQKVEEAVEKVENTKPEAVEKVEKKKPKLMVTGRVTFYGKVNNYKHTGKEFVLCIEDPVFTGIDEESVSKMYDTEHNKKVEYADFYNKLLAGEKLDKVYFRSQYDVESVFTDGKFVDVADIPDFALNQSYIRMTVNKSYIGKIQLLENGVPYNPFED